MTVDERSPATGAETEAGGDERASAEESDLSTLLSSATLVLAGSVLGAVSTLVERIVIGRALPVDAYGRVSVGIAVLTFGATFSLAGLSQGIPRYISRLDDDRDVRGVWVTGLAIAGTLSVGAAVFVTINASFLAGVLFEAPGAGELVGVFALAIPLLVGMRVGVGAIRGLENTIYRTYARDLAYPGLRIGLLVLLLWAGFDAFAAGYAYVIAAGCAFVLAHVLFGRLFELVGPFRPRVRELARFSAPLVVSTLLSTLLTQTDTLMIAVFRGDAAAGFYSFAYPIANGLTVVLASFGFLYLPLASRLDADGRRAEVRAIYRLTAKWIYVLTFPAFLTFVVFSRDVLAILFGSKAAPAGPALAILSIGFFTTAAAGRNRETLSALGHTVAILLANAVAFGLNLALNLVLIPRYGYTGAAVASAASYIALNVVVYLVLRRRFAITPFSRYSARTFLVLPLVLFPPAFLLAGSVDLSAVTFPLFLLGTAFLTVVVVSLAGCLQPEDRVPLDAIEERAGVSIPLVRRYVPEEP
jgi:O-antigen/teichoic acid export membrane protein